MDSYKAKRVLNIFSVYDLNDLRKAYYIKAKEYHPDRYQTFIKKAWATNKFIEVKEAYNHLKEQLIDAGSIHAENIYDFNDHEETNYSDTWQIAFPTFFFFEIFKFPEKYELINSFLSYLFIPLFICFVPYIFFVHAFQTIMKKVFKIEAYSFSKKSIGKIAYCICITLAAFTYLPLFYWMVFTGTGTTPPTRWRIWLGIFLSFLVIITSISEWIGLIIFSMRLKSLHKEIKPRLKL